jgi:hypothetical protein
MVLALGVLLVDVRPCSAQNANRARLKLARQRAGFMPPGNFNNTVVFNQFNPAIGTPINPFFQPINPFQPVNPFMQPVNPFFPAVNPFVQPFDPFFFQFNAVVPAPGRPIGIRPVGIRPVGVRPGNFVNVPIAFNPFLVNPAFVPPPVVAPAFVGPGLNPGFGQANFFGFGRAGPFGLGGAGLAPFGNFAGF